MIKVHERIMRLKRDVETGEKGATPEQLQALEPARAELKKNQDEYDRLDKQYEKIYGAKYKLPE